MSPWINKSVAQKVISWLPFPNSCNYLFQRYITRSQVMDAAAFAFKLRHCRRHLAGYFAGGRLKSGFRVLEIGTGWHPIIPVALYLCGARKIFTIDKTGLLNGHRVRETVRLFLELEPGALAEALPWLRRERLRKLRAVAARRFSVARMLGCLGIEPIVGDAQRTGLPARSIDFVFSNSVIQEIPAQVVQGIFAETRRVAAPGALISHYINMADYRAMSDSSLTPFDFLRYSRRQWKLLSNSLVMLNRLRVADYRALHRNFGLKMLREENEMGLPAELRGVPLAEQFRGYPMEDLLVLRSWIASTPAVD